MTSPPTLTPSSTPHTEAGGGTQTAQCQPHFHTFILYHSLTNTTIKMTTYTDDKSPICIPFIKQHLQTHLSQSPNRPLVIGLNGMQGVGKTTLVAPLAAALATDNINTIVFSLDDFYLTHDEQVKLAAENPENALVQHRGEPGMSSQCITKNINIVIIRES